MTDFFTEGLEAAELHRLIRNEIENNGVVDTTDLLGAVQRHLDGITYEAVASAVALMAATGVIVVETFSKRVRNS